MHFLSELGHKSQPVHQQSRGPENMSEAETHRTLDIVVNYKYALSGKWFSVISKQDPFA